MNGFTVNEMLDKDLNHYCENSDKSQSHNTANAQRVVNIGYSRARHMIERGISKGLLLQCEIDDHKHWIK